MFTWYYNIHTLIRCSYRFLCGQKPHAGFRHTPRADSTCNRVPMTISYYGRSHRRPPTVTRHSKWPIISPGSFITTHCCALCCCIRSELYDVRGTHEGRTRRAEGDGNRVVAKTHSESDSRLIATAVTTHKVSQYYFTHHTTA